MIGLKLGLKQAVNLKHKLFRMFEEKNMKISELTLIWAKSV